jgi:hypothetical protein
LLANFHVPQGFIAESLLDVLHLEEYFVILFRKIEKVYALQTKLFIVRNWAKICKENPRVLHREKKSAEKYFMKSTSHSSTEVAFIYLRLYCWKSAPPPTGAGYNFLPAIYTHFIHA